MKKLQKSKYSGIIDNSHLNVIFKPKLLIIMISFIFTWHFSSMVLSANDENKSAKLIENTRTSIEKWVETKKIISKEKRDLALAREMLNERIDLVEREIETLKGKITQAKESIAEADKKRLEMVDEYDKLNASSILLVDRVKLLEARAKSLLKRLPAPIRDRIKPLSRRLPENSDDTKLSMGERYQNVVGILNEINKFNQQLTITPEVRDLPTGGKAEVTVLYAGIGQAYYVGGKGTIAGIGTVSNDSWIWVPKNEIAPQIDQAIKIMNNEQIAAFISLPLEINQEDK